MISTTGGNLAFLVGLPRSGTTMLAALLDHHPQIACPPEPWIQFAVDSLGRVHERHPAGSQLIAQAVGGFLGDDLVSIQRKLTADIYSKNLHGTKTILVDKTPRYYLILDRIAKLLPDARFIWLKRDPLDVAASYHSTWNIKLTQLIAANSDDPSVFDLLVGPTLISKAATNGGARWIEISYEDLVNNPQTQFDRVCDFLGVSHAPAEIALSSAYTSGRLGDRNILNEPKPHQRSIGAWKKEFGIDEARIIAWSVGSEALDRLGHRGPKDEFGNDSDGWGEKRRAAATHHLELRQMRMQIAAGVEGGVSLTATQDVLLEQLTKVEVDRQRRLEINLRLNGMLAAEHTIALSLRAQIASMERSAEAFRRDLDKKQTSIKILENSLAAERAASDQLRARLKSLIDLLDFHGSERTALIKLASRFKMSSEMERDNFLNLKDRMEAMLPEYESLNRRFSLNETDNRKTAGLNENLERLVTENGISKSRRILLHFMDKLCYPFYFRKTKVRLAGSFEGITRHPLSVGIDVLGIVFGKSGGVEIYMYTLVNALVNSSVRVVLLCNHVQVAKLKLRFADRVEYHEIDRPKGQFLHLIKAVGGFMRGRIVKSATVSFRGLEDAIGIDILHSPIQTFSAFDFDVPAVFNLHDLQHLHFPENFTTEELQARQLLYTRSANACGGIIASSEFVRQDIITRMSRRPDSVHCIPVAVNPEIIAGAKRFGGAEARVKYTLPQRFGFYPAQFWKHKNHRRLIEALRIVRERIPSADFHLVFTGYRGHNGWPEVADAISQLGLDRQVRILDFVPIEHLAGIYLASEFCVMPSLFEASSYPVIEAQTLGVPAMCSEITSLPELMRDSSGLMFDPLSPDSIAACMCRWILDPADARAHAEQGKNRALKENSLSAYSTGIIKLYRLIMSTNG